MPTSRAYLTAAAVASAALLAACGSDPTGSVSPSPAAGTYTLRTINGSSLPASYQSSSSAVTTVLVDTLRLSGTGAWSEIQLSQTAPPGQAATKTDTTQVSGTYVEAASTISFGGRGSATFTGGNTLTFVTSTAQQTGGSSLTTVYVKTGQ